MRDKLYFDKIEVLRNLKHYDGQMTLSKNKECRGNTLCFTYLIFSVALVAALLSACSARIESHGNFPNHELIESIRIGKNSRPQVSAILGTPSAKATFDQEAWYYVGTRTSKFAFLKKEVLERKVLVIRFNKQGIVEQVERLTKKDGREIQIVGRKTPTQGKELNVIQQLLGNIGRFSAAGDGGK